MSPPVDAYDLDAEIAKYGGRVFQTTSVEIADAGAPVAALAPFDLDTEIAKYGGRMSAEWSAQSTADDPLAALRQSDPSDCAQVEAFANVLGASVGMVVSRGASDPRMAAGMSWQRWESRRLDQIIRAGHASMVEARAREEEKKAERAAWAEKWRKVQHGWSKWMRSRLKAPAEAEQYRREHEDGLIDWLVELAGWRKPLGKRTMTGR